MITVKTFLAIAFGINLLAVAFLSFHQYSKLDQSYYSYQFAQKTALSFDDPFKAFYLLERLDVHSAVDDKEIPGHNYSIAAGGFKLNFDYCSENRAYFVNHPEELFEKQNVVVNYGNFHQLIKKVLPMIHATDVHPDIFPRKKIPLGSYVYDLDPKATVFYMHNLFFYWRQIGKQWSCLAQASNHIPGHDKIYRKDYGAEALVEYAATYKSRPRCFTFNEFFPKTWVLKKKDQCENFFAEFNSSDYLRLKEERNVVYFRKIGADAHEGSGVFPVTNEEEAKIRALYKNGSLCGSVTANNLIQYNVWNPLLLENRKFGFRMFMLIASTNPVIAYYHDGYLRLSLDEYNANSKDIKTFVTNIGVNMKEAKKKDSIFAGMTEEQINEYTCWFLEKFQDYLLEKGIINDNNWLDGYLRPQFKRVMIHLIRMSQGAYLKKSSVFELYGLDFVMDADLGLWYIETNTMPLVNGFTKGSTILMNRMLADTFEIIFGLVRSRMKRVILYINKLSGEFGDQSYNIPDLQTKREEFRKITMNRFEPEFEPSVGNTFQKIIDENEVGTARYLDLISSDCL